MKKKLSRFARSIWTQLILQNPSEEFVKAYNAYFNWMKENTEETEEDHICLVHDELCNEMADCHLISRKANLAPIADENSGLVCPKPAPLTADFAAVLRRPQPMRTALSSLGIKCREAMKFVKLLE